MSTAKERYERCADELARVCEQAGRSPEEVRLVAVSKTVGPQDVACAIEGGAVDFGENRPDQLVMKADLYPQVKWHFIGNIQSRRLRDVVGRATLVHSLYQESHARKISEIAIERGIVQDVLVEVNVSGELSKSGLSPADVPAFVETCAQLTGLRVRGLMTMAPQGDADVARRTFEGLAQLKTQLEGRLPDEQRTAFTELSMGMSEDWREAVAAGATIVRIGRAIFSETF